MTELTALMQLLTIEKQANQMDSEWTKWFSLFSDLCSLVVVPFYS